MLLTAGSLRTKANAEVPILWVCRQIGMEVPDDVSMGRSARVYCPFGSTAHPDGGEEAAFRVYPDTNSAWCFAEREYFSPVKLFATWNGLPETEAARQLLESLGISVAGHRELTPATQVTVDLRVRADPPDLHSLAEALKMYCARECVKADLDWELLQLDGPVAEKLSQCLNLLNRVSSASDAQQWLSVTKQAMGAVLT